METKDLVDWKMYFSKDECIREQFSVQFVSGIESVCNNDEFYE